TIIQFNPSASLGFDPSFDAHKLQSLDPNVPYIASLIDTADMVVNAIPGLHLSYEIPLRVSTGIQGTFNLNSNDLHNIANEACFFIEDLHLDSLFDLRNMPFGYDFHLDDTTTAPRFVLHIGRQDSIQAENISCFGSNNGSLQIDGNGWGPWDLTISNSQGIVHNVNQLTTTDTVVNLSPGWYFVDIQSAQLGCNNVNDSIFIDEPALLVIDSLGGSKPSCDNASNASMHIVASGGTGVLNLLWSNGSTADSLFDLNSGTYSLSVTDDNQCLSVDSFIIEDPGSINISLDSLINLQCANDNSGAISLVAIGNTSPYTFNWSNGGSSQNLSSLSSGTYSVTVTDVLGCMDTLMNLSVSEPLPLLISVDSIDHIGCDGLSDGLIIASSIGGTLPLTYTWSNGAQGLVADSLASGTFTVTATDQNGCTSQKAVTVQALATVTADFNVSQDTIELISGGAIVDFTNTSIGATSTHWDFGDGSAFYAVDPSYQYSDTGLYLVTLVASSPDCDDTVSKNVYIKNPASTSINDVFENKMTRVYYSRLLNQFVAEVSGISLPYDLRLLNMNGQMILSHSQVNTSRIEIGNESLSSGTYFISITNDQIQETHKVILP
ncbi:MAG: T9SS type A sorting domain-containing protein, partial [Flavobacteriales bacterium]|nr:T9SS type A sorting domain-containing protein [Flavobacteriales bacterium]